MRVLLGRCYKNAEIPLLGYFAEIRLRVSPPGFCPPFAPLPSVGSYLILNVETGSSSKVAESGMAPATMAAMPSGARKNGGTPRLQTT